MAELAPASRTSLLSRLRKKPPGEAKKQPKNRKKSKPNPYASRGLEKVAVLVAELQAKKASLVDKTGNSVSAVRYLSRSAQEWTATTIARTATRCREKETSHPPELLLLHSSLRPVVLAEDKSSKETIDFSESFSFTRYDAPPADEDDANCHGFVIAGQGYEDAAKAEDESREPQAAGYVQEEVRRSAKAADVAGLSSNSWRFMKKARGFAPEEGWKRVPDSAVAVLVSFAAYMAKVVGRPLAAAMTFSVVIRRWRRGSLCTEFVFSAVARCVLTPLHSYLAIRLPRRMAIVAGKATEKEEPDVTREFPVATAEVVHSRKPEIDIAHERNPSFAFPIVGDAAESPTRPGAPLSLLLTASEINPAPPASATSLSPTSSLESAPSSPTRRLARLSSKLKSKVFRCSPSVAGDALSRAREASLSPSGAFFCDGNDNPSEPGSPARASPSPSASPSRDSSPERKRKFSFARRAKAKAQQCDSRADDTLRRQQASETKPNSPRKCLLRRDDNNNKPSYSHGDNNNPSACRKSALSRMSSVESMDHLASAPAPHNVEAATTTTTPHNNKNNGDVWPAVGLLIALLFLLVGRFPAILATSLSFLVISQAHKLGRRAHRGPPVGRALDAARKLYRSPPPSPGRGDALLNEFRKRPT